MMYPEDITQLGRSTNRTQRFYKTKWITNHQQTNGELSLVIPWLESLGDITKLQEEDFITKLQEGDYLGARSQKGRSNPQPN